MHAKSAWLRSEPVPTESTTRRRGPYKKSARVKAEILEKAEEAFAQRGFTGTSVREIALAVGMTQQGLSHHFASKEALLMAVLQHRDELAVDQYKGRGLSAIEILRAIVEDNLAKPGLIQLTMILTAEAIDPEHPAHEYFVERFERARAIFESLLRWAQGRGEVRDDIDAAELAAFVVASFEGLQIQWLVDPRFDLERAFDTVVRVLVPVGDTV